MDTNKTLFDPEEMLSPFEAIKETDGDGHDWWNSRKLARLMGYQKYWNFERLMDSSHLPTARERLRAEGAHGGD